MLVLDSGNTEVVKTVTTAELESKDQIVKPISKQIPIAHLAPDNELSLKHTHDLAEEQNTLNGILQMYQCLQILTKMMSIF